jgi:hypothetical protein
MVTCPKFCCQSCQVRSPPRPRPPLPCRHRYVLVSKRLLHGPPGTPNLPEAAAIGKNESPTSGPGCDALPRGVRPCSRSHTLRASSGAHRITEAAKEREGQ